MERLDKILSGRGVLSRSETKKAVKAGRILVNGVRCTTSDLKIDQEKDIVTIDGKDLETGSMVYYMLNKPSGYITAREDKKEACIFDLIDDKRRDLAAVGRLDKDTTGILLLTNDGKLNHYMLSPGKHVLKRYVALIDGRLTETAIDSLRTGIDIGDEKPTRPAEVEILNTDTPQTVALTICEGRFHQVKRMFEAVGCPVIKLDRTDFGPLKLDEKLERGAYRKLTEEEISLCMNCVGNDN